ncbi:hypothetical protein F6X53_25175 [Methylobacterium soli]|uniref:Uncharacterized protein n=2 Tax=Methylobacterium soli TaxID=553447 RepID=A0A6L3SVK0_9HYPH|nr:hypothetical protein F6X53_25175 [Methylobacterium soli]
MSASLAPRPTPSDVQAWRDAFSRLKPSVPPCPGISASAWPPMHEAALDALDRHGAALVEHGWTAPELFGVHPTIGTVRVDFCGAFVLGGRKVETVLADRINFGLMTYYRNVPGAGVGIPIWDFRW